MEMGEKIKQLRKERGMTLEQLGDLVGVGKSTVRKWENGMIANMRRDKISKIADALGVSPAYLMGWEDTAADQDHVAEAIQMVPSDLSDEAIRIGSAYDAAEEWEKDAVAKLLDVKRDADAEVLGA